MKTDYYAPQAPLFPSPEVRERKRLKANSHEVLKELWLTVMDARNCEEPDDAIGILYGDVMSRAMEAAESALGKNDQLISRANPRPFG